MTVPLFYANTTPAVFFAVSLPTFPISKEKWFAEAVKWNYPDKFYKALILVLPNESFFFKTIDFFCLLTYNKIYALFTK